MNVKKIGAAILAGVMMIGSAVSASAEDKKVEMTNKSTGQKYGLKSFIFGHKQQKDNENIEAMAIMPHNKSISENEVIYTYQLNMNKWDKYIDNTYKDTYVYFSILNFTDDILPFNIDFTVNDTIAYSDGRSVIKNGTGRVEITSPETVPESIAKLSPPTSSRSSDYALLSNNPQNIAYTETIVVKMKKDSRYTYSLSDSAIRPKGDANGDNKIDVTDIAVISAHIKGITALSDTVNADVNGDGEVNVTDIALIASHIKGIKALT